MTLELKSEFGHSPSPVMRNIEQTVERIALSDLGVLIVGAFGTGKEWLARMIHRLSGRSAGRLVSIDCASIPPASFEKELMGSEELTLGGVEVIRGAFEDAAGGTLLLKGVGEIPPTLQSRIARILERQNFRRIGGFEEIVSNVRLIATMTKKTGDAPDSIHAGNDLYYRICPIVINLPPLKERREDIPFLVERFIAESEVKTAYRPRGMTADALQVCNVYDWPGNARELRSVIDHAIRVCSEQFIRKIHLPEYLQQFGVNHGSVAMEEIVPQ